LTAYLMNLRDLQYHLQDAVKMKFEDLEIPQSNERDEFDEDED